MLEFPDCAKLVRNEARQVSSSVEIKHTVSLCEIAFPRFQKGLLSCGT